MHVLAQEIALFEESKILDNPLQNLKSAFVETFPSDYKCYCHFYMLITFQTAGKVFGWK